MKYSILGANGFLSTAIAKYCNVKGYELDIYGLEEPTIHRFDRFCKINLMNDTIDINQLLDSDVIVYSIGAGIQSNLKESYTMIYALNVTAPVNICNQLRVANYQGKLITFGSVFEMGETYLRHPFAEEEVLTSNDKAPNEYTVSKRMLSRFVSSYGHEFTHWHFFIPTIYGEGENPKRLIPYVINSIRNNEELHFTDGDQVRQYIYVGEIPKIIDECVINNVPSGVYNLEGNETLTIKEIVNLIHATFGKVVPEGCFGTAQRTDVGMRYLALDGAKLRSFLCFSISSDIASISKLY
ncbi:MAG: NAD-dependent epimerase/dehydratase family protein [Eubacteriales bacterium]|nr:NAD-dependent epimerase/dehydratase family protein [Eubacteriales bacterium]